MEGFLLTDVTLIFDKINCDFIQERKVGCMLDFIRDIVLEARGIDSDKWHRERLEKEEAKKANVYLLSKKTKIIIFIFGIVYLLIEVINMIVFLESNGSLGLRAKGILLAVIDIIVLICLAQKSKKAEIAAIVLSIIFIISMYASTMLLRWY